MNPDTMTSTTVIRIHLGEKMMGQLLSGQGFTVNYPNAEAPTHQFQMTLDPALQKKVDEPVVDKLVVDGVADEPGG